MEVGQPSLDQLRIFLAVVEEGSFNAAARRTGRALSAISYGIATLEAQLGTALFLREGSRKPSLTPAGQALLPNARAVADSVDALMARARSQNRGLESELTLAVDVMLPPALLAGLLSDFQSAFPTVDLRLHVEALGAVPALVLEGRADVGVGGPVAAQQPGLERRMLGAVPLVPVAAPDHPLAQMTVIPPGEARHHLQLVLTDRSPLTRGRDFSVLSPRSWRLADLGAKHALLLQGIGWGNMPLHAVADDLAAGRLVQLPVPDAPGLDYGFALLWRGDCPPGPARLWMEEALAARLVSPQFQASSSMSQ